MSFLFPLSGRHSEPVSRELQSIHWKINEGCSSGTFKKAASSCEGAGGVNSDSGTAQRTLEEIQVGQFVVTGSLANTLYQFLMNLSTADLAGELGKFLGLEKRSFL